MTIVSKADPYSWPHDGKMEPSTTAVIVIDMQVCPQPPFCSWLMGRRAARPVTATVTQVDFVGKGGYVDMMGYDLAAMQAPIGPIKCAGPALIRRFRPGCDRPTTQPA